LLAEGQKEDYGQSVPNLKVKLLHINRSSFLSKHKSCNVTKLFVFHINSVPILQ